MTATAIDQERVRAIFLDCLFEESDDGTYIMVESITIDARFDPERLNAHKEEIMVMLNELPDGFMVGSGDGTSFLKACKDRNGNQWTDSLTRMQELFLLGMGIGRVRLFLPRELWHILPDDMPYYIVTE